MKALARYTRMRLLALLLALLPVLLTGLAPGSALAEEQAVFSQQQLDQMLAPIALYPDPLLSQLFMASTHAEEVVEAARWSRANPGLQGDAAVIAVAQQNWDPSVKSLVAFPQLLVWIEENLEWMRGLGDAFLAQEPQVMETVQNLRRRAQAAGTLRSDDRIRVLDEAQNIALVPADPRIVYVPYYDPLLIYGTWWSPAYPPVRWRPWPGYFVRPGYAASLPSLYWGPGIVISTRFFFGAFDWPRRQVRVVSTNYHHYNTVTVNRHPAHAHSNPAAVNPVNPMHPVHPLNRGPGVWQHNPAHRGGVRYRDPAVQRQFATPHVDTHLPNTTVPVPRTTVPVPRAREPHAGIHVARPEALRAAVIPPVAPRAIAPHPEFRAPREAPRVIALHPEFRAAQPHTGGVAGARAEPRNHANREPGRSTGHDARPASPGRGPGDHRGPG